MVYFVYADDGYMFDWGFHWLDGDLDKMKPADMSPDDGIRIKPGFYTQGRALEPDHVPTKARVGGRKRKLADVLPGSGSLVVDDKFRTILEELEPGVHQFFPLDLVWKDGSSAGRRHWFNPCNRIDGPDREKSTWVFDVIWLPKNPHLPEGEKPELVFSRAKIGDRHAWVEKRISGRVIMISDAFKHRLDEAGVTGIGFKYDPETD